MIRIKTKIPGPKSARILDGLKKKNGGWGLPYPFVHSHKGKGVYCEDLDGNVFLDFGCQIASNPLGYNNSSLLDVIKNIFPILLSSSHAKQVLLHTFLKKIFWSQKQYA